MTNNSEFETNKTELTIVGFTTCQTRDGKYLLGIPVGNIPKEIKRDHLKDLTAGQWIRIRLKNTDNLDKKHPGWDKQWNKQNIAVDITSWEDNFSIVKDHGHYTLTIILRDDAEIVRWYNDNYDESLDW